MTSALLLVTPGSGLPTLESDLEEVGIPVVGASDCDNLVRDAARLAPDVVICCDDHPADGLFAATRLLQVAAPLPVLVFTADAQAESLQQALASGIHGWVVQGYAQHRLRPLLQLAQARFAAERQQREALRDVTHRFEERKLVDRAKGILMRARQIPEEEAFRVLRAASMHGKQRVGQVSQQVIDAARDADALNRAGQLRMLSQRLVKLQALVVAGTDTAAARALLKQSLERCAQQVEHLQRQLSKPTHGDLLDAVQRAFDALHKALQAPADRAGLTGIDTLAEQLLSSANHLANVLQGAGPAGSLHVINVSGRQRMLSQRLAKQVLLDFLLGGAPSAPGAAQQTVQSFEQALRHLHELPLSTADIRQTLSDADAQWQRMLRGVQAVATAPGRIELAQASEALLALFEQLTESYERSMQVLMG